MPHDDDLLRRAPRASLATLPLELLMQIASHVDRAAAAVCRLWHSAVSQVAMCPHWLGFDVDQRDANQHTALHRAARSGDATAVRRLLEAGATVDVADARGITPLHVAACRNYAPIVRLLCGAGASVDRRHHSGKECLDSPLISSKSALHMAAQRGHEDAVRALLEAGASRHQLDDGARCPIDLCAARRVRRLLRTFVQRPAVGARPPSADSIDS